MPALRIALSALRMLLLGAHVEKRIRVLHVQQVSVHPEQPLSITLDGEIAGNIPGTFSLRAEGLRVICPPPKASGKGRSPYTRV